MVHLPQPALRPPGRLLGVDEIGIGSEAIKHPGMPLGNQFAVEIAIVEPERAEEPAMLVAGPSGHSHPASDELLIERVAG